MLTARGAREVGAQAFNASTTFFLRMGLKRERRSMVLQVDREFLGWAWF